ncbi:hypothetical protein [uncultured Thalassolituus sp.]|uniref:hypothetical protein n=1 Tax=uncultured Thalassolituus sp. TaxID=285273 RepID=UPI00260DCF87|nr:hypothetical protein [uncultured Thalassolituus sp.]
MRTKIGNYKLRHVNRKRKDWRRIALTELGLLVNAWVSAFFVPMYWLADSNYAVHAVLGSAFVLSSLCCIGLFLIRHSTLRESSWVSNIPSIIFEVSIGIIGFYLLMNFLLKGYPPILLVLLLALYALPFVYESVLPRPAGKSEIFGSSIADTPEHMDSEPAYKQGPGLGKDDR